jgi:hypothetical protein
VRPSTPSRMLAVIAGAATFRRARVRISCVGLYGPTWLSDVRQL